MVYTSPYSISIQHHYLIEQLYSVAVLSNLGIGWLQRTNRRIIRPFAHQEWIGRDTRIQMTTTITASLMSVLLLDRDLQALPPDPDLDALTSHILLHRISAAEHGGAAPLLSKTGVLAGKHPEAEDAPSRDATIEVSPLLQLVEAYSGLAILTTQLNQALDVACSA